MDHKAETPCALRPDFNRKHEPLLEVYLRLAYRYFQNEDFTVRMAEQWSWLAILVRIPPLRERPDWSSQGMGSASRGG